MHYLTDRLPKSNYGNESEPPSYSKINTQSGKHKSNVSTNVSLRGLNLPALDRVVIKNNISKLPVIGVEERKHHHIDHRNLGGMLRIEGRSQARHDYEPYH